MDDAFGFSVVIPAKAESSDFAVEPPARCPDPKGGRQ
jgi:hypothetical protein